MKAVYQTVDGSIFDTEEQARAYEEKILSGLKMWNRAGREVFATNEAFAVWFKDTNANQLFFQLAREAGDEALEGLQLGESTGLYIWDDWGAGAYTFVDPEQMLAIMAAGNYLMNEKNNQ